MRREKALLFELMEREGMTQYRLAKNLGKSRQTVNMVLHSDSSMSIENLTEYANAIGYELEITATRKETA